MEGWVPIAVFNVSQLEAEYQVDYHTGDHTLRVTGSGRAIARAPQHNLRVFDLTITTLMIPAP